MTSTNELSTATGLAPDALGEHLRRRLGDGVVDVVVQFGQVTVTVAPAALPEAVRLCKDSPDLDFDLFDFMAGVDLGEEGFAVVTHLYSVRHRHHITLRVVAPGGREQPALPSITGIYRGANWHEREAYDMFGIDFEGHPGLLPRILTAENFEGFPLRKDFLLSTREAKPWPGLKEPKAVGSDEEEAADATAAETPASAEEKAEAGRTRAERARAKAAAMRASKQAEKENAQAASTTEAEAAGAARAGDDVDAQAAAAQETAGGDTGKEGAAKVAAAAGEPEPQTPEGAADIAGSDIAKDAAAGSVGGDTAAGAPGDEAGSDQPVHDPEAEAKIGEGAPSAPSGAPGVEQEGSHGGAEAHGTDAPTPSRSRPGEEEPPAPSETLEDATSLEERPEDADGREGAGS